MNKIIVNNDNDVLIKRILGIALVVYFVLSGLFYVLAGEQLHFRASKGNIKQPIATGATTELVKNTTVTEKFVNKIQILDKFSITWGDYKRINQGKINVVLVDLNDGSILLSSDIDASGIKEGQQTEFIFDKPIEGLYNHKMSINITALDGEIGSSATPLMRNGNELENAQLFINNRQVDGVLCFSMLGKDHVWLGMHYWKFVLIGAAVLSIWFCIMIYRLRKNKKIIVLNAIIALRRYKFLIQQMVSRDFKTKYKRSVLGIFWSFLNPLLMMAVQYFVFSTVFKNDIPYYHIYLLIGVVMFNFFSEACAMTLNSILGNANLLTKVYVPKYIYPLVRVSSSTVNLLISLIPLFVIVVFSGINLTKAAFLIIYALICLIVFSLGLGLLLATSMVFFRDTQFLWGVVSVIWNYITPVFYPESILPKNYAVVLQFNPLYYYINFVRSCIIDGISPEPRVYFICAMCSIIMFVLGVWVFKKNQDKFIFYL